MLPTVHDGQRASGLRFGEPRTMALLGSMAAFSHLIGGLTNKTLRQQMGAQWNPTTARARPAMTFAVSASRVSSNAIDHTNTYWVTARGRRMATFFTKLATPVVVPALTKLDSLLRPPKQTPLPLREAWRTYERSVDALVRKRLAA